MADATTSQVAVIAKLPAAPGKRDELAAAFRVAVDNVQGEAGTSIYILHADAKDPDLLWVYELYADQASLDSHMSTDGYKALGPQLGPFLGGRVELISMQPLFGKGL